jgi:Skp family chaperone for outer membrane proteins
MDLISKSKQHEGQVKVFQSKEDEFNARAREFESKEKDFDGRVRKFEVKQLKVQMEDIKSKENQCECDKQVKDIELIESHYEALMKLSEEEIESGKCSSSSSLLRQFHFNFIILIFLTY